MAAAETISFKDLCIDATNSQVLADFWASALGLHAEQSGGDFRLVDGVPEHTFWVNKVPEPRTVKQRVHLDVHVAAVSALTDLGAVILDETQPWTVLADPEGGELCAFVRDLESLPGYRVYEVVVDSADPATIASWWAERYGCEVCHDRDRGFSWIEGRQGCPGRWSSNGSPSRRLSRTVCIGTCGVKLRAFSRLVPSCSAAMMMKSAGTYSPTLKATNSAFSLGMRSDVP